MIKTRTRIIAVILTVLTVITAIPMFSSAKTVNSDGYIEIYTIEDLYNVRDDLTANYILMNDIDLTEATSSGGEWNADGNGWNPIDGTFSGNFNGNGNKIIGLNINRASAGLFLKVSGNVYDLKMLNVNISGCDNVGAFAATADGATFIDCFVYGEITGSYIASKKSINTGGFIGSGVSTSFVRCVNYGTVTGGTYTGGFAGSLTGTSKVEGCFNAGTITANYNNGYKSEYVSNPGFKAHSYAYNYASGIAATVSGSVTMMNSYNCGTIKVSTKTDTSNSTQTWDYYAYSGGMVATGKATITHCYNVGTITGKTASYAIGPAGSISECYFLTEKGSVSTGANSLTESQMKLESIYKGFDFDNVWIINEYANYPYPQLRNNVQDLSERIELVRLITLPRKLEYMTGDKLSLDGGLLEVIYVSGRSETIALTSDMISGYESESAGNQTLTVTYEGYTFEFDITVTQRPKVTTIYLISEPTVKEFVVGTAFDFSGAKLQVAYETGLIETVDVTEDMLSGGDINKLGKQTITVSFEDKTDSFNITVIPVDIIGISVKSMPSKIVYLEKEELDTTGLVLTLKFNNGKESDISDGYTVSGFSSKPGIHTLTVSYLDFSTTFTVTVREKRLTGITLESAPKKAEYYQGDEFDPTGMVIVASYDNGDREIVEEYTVTGFGEYVGLNTVKVSYGGYSVSFIVRIYAKTVTGIDITTLPLVLTYLEGEKLNTSGMVVTATYNNGDKLAVKDYQISGYSSKPGTHTVSVIYEGYVGTFTVTVLKKSAVGITVTPPEKLTYHLNESFDATGLTVTVNYDNGDKEVTEDYQVSGFDSSAPGSCVVKVTYNGYSRNFVVTVLENCLPDAHVWGNWKVVTPAKCESDGKQTRTCIYCDASETETVEKLGHSFTSYASDNNATCTEDGTKTSKCDRCNVTDTLTDTDSALGHSFTNYLSDNNATCTADGTKTAKCDRCTVTDTLTDTDSVLGHSFTNYLSDNNATCTADGTKTAKCDRCEVTDKMADIDSALGHSFTNYLSDNNATCTEDGTKTSKCDRCNVTDTLTDADSALGHSFTNYVSDNNATCTADGTKTSKCDRCEVIDTMADMDSALGHSFTNYVSDNNATCTEDGTKTAKCDRCDITDTVEDAGSMSKHSYGEWYVALDPTYFDEGVEERVCSVCSEKETNTLPVKEYTNPFTDVKESHWFYSSVEFVVKKGYMKGMSDTTFSPNSNITREQFVLILANIAGVDTNEFKTVSSGFADVPTGQWYSGAVTWAVREGYVSGMSADKFGRGQSIQRAALARMLYNYASKNGINVDGRADLSAFGDVKEFEKAGNAWMVEPIQWAVDAGIISGMEINGKLSVNPKGTATRAQAAVMLMKFDELLK